MNLLWQLRSAGVHLEANEGRLRVVFPYVGYFELRQMVWSNHDQLLQELEAESISVRNTTRATPATRLATRASRLIPGD
jgi:hypothetical protein